MKKIITLGLTTLTLSSSVFALSFHKSYILPHEMDFNDYKSSIKNIICENTFDDFSDQFENIIDNINN